MGGDFAKAGLVLALILVSGFFAAMEMALVSLRESQVSGMASHGRRGRLVKKLHGNPNRFLAAGQIGVTLAGFLSAALGAEAFAADLAPWLVKHGWPHALATAAALVGVTLIISYFSLVLGELAPKRIALQRAQGVALAGSGVLDFLASVFRPVIWLLSRSSDVIVRLVGGNPAATRTSVTEEELHLLISESVELGAEGQRIVTDVLRARETVLREVMVPRTEADFIDASTPVYRAAQMAIEHGRSRFPVIQGSPDEVVGFVHVRDLLDPANAGRTRRVGEIARPVMMLPGSKPVIPAITDMQGEHQQLAIVVDEYGGTAGIVTMEDLVEELVGEIRDEYDDPDDSASTVRPSGDVEVGGLLSLQDFADETGIELPEGPYETVAGYLAYALGRLPVVDNHVDVDGHRLTVLALDGRRVERVLVTRLASAPDESL